RPAQRQRLQPLGRHSRGGQGDGTTGGVARLAEEAFQRFACWTPCRVVSSPGASRLPISCRVGEICDGPGIAPGRGCPGGLSGLSDGSTSVASPEPSLTSSSSPTPAAPRPQDPPAPHHPATDKTRSYPHKLFGQPL